MAMKYQQGTVYLCGQKVKMWYGKYLIYGKDREFSARVRDVI